MQSALRRQRTSRSTISRTDRSGRGPRWLGLALVGLLLCLGPSPTRAARGGIVGAAAPSWKGVDWVQLPGNAKALDVADLKGKVVYLFFFQSWCPGCHSHGFPTMQKVYDRYREADDVVFVAVQTVFEGHWTNTRTKTKTTCERFGLGAIAIGHAAGASGGSPALMRRYRSGGTPWTVIIDPDGTVRFDGFRISEKQATTLIARLRKPETKK